MRCYPESSAARWPAAVRGSRVVPSQVADLWSQRSQPDPGRSIRFTASTVRRILAEQFRLHTTQRRYLAVAVGRVGEGTIISNLVRDRGDGRRGSKNPADAGDPTEGKRAVTHVKPVEHFGDAYTLVECQLETGRTHQIRIHLAESGHPLCGERVYSAPRGAKATDRSGAARVTLHAAELGFVHPRTGDALHFESRIPADIAALITRLRR